MPPAASDTSPVMSVEPKLAEMLLRTVEASERAIGDHWAPNDCYATGPLTGDRIADLVECPACTAMKVNEDARKALADLRVTR